MPIKTVGVVGAGTMGNGIAQVFAQSGFSVQLVDVAPAMLDKARVTIEKSLAKFVEKGTLGSADRDAALGRLTTATEVDTLDDPELHAARNANPVITFRTLLSTSVFVRT